MGKNCYGGCNLRWSSVCRGPAPLCEDRCPWRWLAGPARCVLRPVASARPAELGLPWPPRCRPLPSLLCPLRSSQLEVELQLSRRVLGLSLWEARLVPRLGLPLSSQSALADVFCLYAEAHGACRARLHVARVPGHEFGALRRRPGRADDVEARAAALASSRTSLYMPKSVEPAELGCM